jgi:uncharacterized protein YxeA
MKTPEKILKEILIGFVAIIFTALLALWICKNPKPYTGSNTLIWENDNSPSVYRSVCIDEQQVLIPIE